MSRSGSNLSVRIWCYGWDVEIDFISSIPFRMYGSLVFLGTTVNGSFDRGIYTIFKEASHINDAPVGTNAPTGTKCCLLRALVLTVLSASK